MALETLCPPALIYLVFSVTQIIIDSSHGLYNTALMKFFVAILFTTLLTTPLNILKKYQRLEF